MEGWESRAMKRIRLHCVGCAAHKVFSGWDAREIVESIDAAKWHDVPDYDRKHSKGNAPGYCPTCWAKLPDREEV